MKIKLERIRINNNRAEYDYYVDEEAAIFFNSDTPLFIEYFNDIDLSEVPESIMTIPFVANLLALVWIYDIELTINVIDESFYKSIPKMKKGYQMIFNNVMLRGKIICDNIMKNKYEASNHKTCLFSGGVDATYTFLRHRKEDVTLVNIWGVDVGLDDDLGHNEMENYFHKFADNFKKEYLCIKSSLRIFINEKYLNENGYEKIKDYWWHGAQHSIGMLSLLAPFNYIRKTKINYIASSFTKKEQEQGVRCISYPVVDSQLKMGETTCFHDGFETARIGKVQYICNVRKKENLNFDIKVCFHYEDGNNCSKCEKCMRTMAAILIYDDDVEKYGFSPKCNNGRQIRRFLDTHEVGKFRWLPIQEAYSQNPTNKNMKWIKSYQFNNMSSFRSRLIRLINKILSKL